MSQDTASGIAGQIAEAGIVRIKRGDIPELVYCLMLRNGANTGRVNRIAKTADSEAIADAPTFTGVPPDSVRMPPICQPSIIL